MHRFNRTQLTIFGVLALMVVVLVPVALVIAFNTSGEENDTVSTAVTPGHELQTVAGVPAAAQVVEVVDFDYKPKDVTVKAGQTIGFKNTGATQHTVDIDGQDGSGPIQPGAAFQWTPDEPGTFSFHCAIHPNLMTGKITVEKQ